MSERQINFSDLIQKYIDGSLAGLHVASPGRVESYDAASCKANVQPCIKKKLRSGEVIEPPVITNVPVVWPRTATSSIFMPISAGDYVLLIFCERSIDAWLSLGGVVDPEDYRKFDMSDAVALPGLFPFGQGKTVVSDHLQIRNGSATITVKSNGDIEIGGGVVTKLVNEAFQTLYNAHTHPVSGGATLAPTVLMTDAQLTGKVKAE